MKWGEVNGREEETTKPHIIPKDRMEKPEIGLDSNYLKAVKEQIEGGYDSVDGIVNNGKRDGTDNRAESGHMSVKGKFREQEGEPWTRPTELSHRERGLLYSDRNLCR